MNEVRIYVEGGGDHADGKARLREGFSHFLRELVELARQRRIKWSIIACGSRNDAFDDFQRALKTHPHAFNVLLVDAEAPVQGGPWQHLQERDGWQRPDGAEDDQCHLMVQTMEAWLVADRAALDGFYGRGFNPNALPRNQQVEQVDKDSLAEALDRATRQTTAGKYHKIRHGTQLIGRVNPATVRAAAPFCERLFATLKRKLTDP